MSKHDCRLPALILCIMMMILALCAGTASAEEEINVDFLGKPFPDFTAMDTEGNTFTLSEALNDYEAVLINLWATWCAPCQNEFPYINEVYREYNDRVAFIALSREENDTLEKIEEYRSYNGFIFPMGRDEGAELYRYVGTGRLPTTVVVDRFGNAVSCHASGFSSMEEVKSILDPFLGDDYTETAVVPGREDADTDENPEDAPQAYSVMVVDQNGYPVEGVIVNFCTDTACTPGETDQTGLITFTGEPDAYHVQIIEAPEGYSWDEEEEIYTSRKYGDLFLYVRKD